MISDLVYINRDFNTFNQVKSRPMYSPSGLSTTSLSTKDLYHLANILKFIVDKTDVYTKEKS